MLELGDCFHPSQFHFLSREVAKAADIKSENLVSGLKNLAALSPLIALGNYETLPFTTSMAWIESAAELQRSSCLSNIFYSPWLLGTSELKAWESYAAANLFWFQSDASTPSPFNTNVWEYTDNETMPVVSTEASVHSPLWMSYPVPTNTSVINIDLASISELGLNAEIISPILSSFISDDDQDENITTVWDFFEWNNETLGPRSFLFYHITNNQGDVIGHTGAEFAWENFFDTVSGYSKGRARRFSLSWCATYENFDTACFGG